MFELHVIWALNYPESLWGVNMRRVFCHHSPDLAETQTTISDAL